MVSSAQFMPRKREVMVPYLEYNQRKLQDLTLQFAPQEEFREVVDAVRSVRLPPLSVNAELAAFSVLELLSNSLRAHQEHRVQESVRLTYSLLEKDLRIEILDAGRGFDPSRLPYSLDDPPGQVDPSSESFVRYRLQNGGRRFGMGILAARRTFPGFDLAFVDKTLRPCPWFSGLVHGTRIILSAPLALDSAVDNLEELPMVEARA